MFVVPRSWSAISVVSTPFPFHAFKLRIKYFVLVATECCVATSLAYRHVKAAVLKKLAR